jgi:tetratricopeptide (TPR) repeat protein
MICHFKQQVTLMLKTTITPIAFISFRRSIVKTFLVLMQTFIACIRLSGGAVVCSFLLATCCFLPTVAFSQVVDSVGSLKSGVAQFNTGNYEGAEVELNKAVELNPKNSDAFFYLAEVSFIQHEDKKAMENYNKSIELNSTNPKAYKGRGRVKAKLEDYYGSIQDFTKAIELDKNYSDAYFNRALSYLNLKDYKSAIADFSEVIKMNPKDYQAYSQRGTAKFESGDKKGACLDWSKAGELGYSKIYDTIKKNCK